MNLKKEKSKLYEGAYKNGKYVEHIPVEMIHTHTNTCVQWAKKHTNKRH